MPNELSPQEFNSIKNFADGLREVFQNCKGNHQDSLLNIILNYAIQIIEIHLALKELEVEQYIFNQKKLLDR